MKRRIHKFKLNPTMHQQKILMPFNAKILTVQTQMGKPYIWAMVNDNSNVEYEFTIFDTGEEIPNDFDTVFDHTYVGTYQLFGGAEIYHLFKKNL